MMVLFHKNIICFFLWKKFIYERRKHSVFCFFFFIESVSKGHPVGNNRWFILIDYNILKNLIFPCTQYIIFTTLGNNVISFLLFKIRQIKNEKRTHNVQWFDGVFINFLFVLMPEQPQNKIKFQIFLIRINLFNVWQSGAAIHCEYFN